MDFANAVMETICEKRTAYNLHGIAIQWGVVGDVGLVLENFNTINCIAKHSSTVPSCMKTINTFIDSSDYVCRSFVELEYQGSTAGSPGDLLKKITHVLGISDPSTLDDNTTLGDLSLDSLMAVEIKQGLERDYNTVLSTKDIRQLKIRQIREMSEKQTNFDLVSKTESDYWSNFENPKELFTRFDKEIPGLQIFFIPPIEGDFKLIKPLIDHISRPVIGINWTNESDSLISVEEVATYYIKNIREKYLQPEYEFVAYSFGSMIAVEMCVQLQDIDANLPKKLFVLDGDIDFMKYRTQKLIEKANVADETGAFQKMLIGFMTLIYPIEIIAKLRTELVALSTKDEQMKRAVDFINNFGYEKCTEELLKLAVQRSFEKLKMVLLYEPRNKFKENVKLNCSTREDGSPDPHWNESKFRQSIDGSFNAIIIIGDHRSFLTNNYEDISNLLEDQLYYVTS